MSNQSYTERYLSEVSQIADALDRGAVQQLVGVLTRLQSSGGRLFVLGVGGSAGNASHAVNDFRKITGIEAYTPTDNVSELTARINDDGWDSSFAGWLEVSRLRPEDAVLVFSVGGGNAEAGISTNIVYALDFARKIGASILGIVGRDGGYTARVSDACVIVPTVNSGTITPHTEAFQAVVWHLIVSHPALKRNEMKWESTLPSDQTALPVGRLRP